VPTIRVSEDVYEKLRDLKKKLGHGSFSETIAWLVDRATNPRTFLESLAYWLEDMRSDMKTIAKNLEKLTKLLESLR